MKVSELARRTGVSAHRLRHYEALALIRAARTRSGHREFGEQVVREVVFIAMSRELGFSLKEIERTLPRYRAGTLSHDELIGIMRERIAAVDAQIAEQRAVRRRLTSHIAWLEKRRREHLQRRQAPATPAWPGTRKARP